MNKRGNITTARTSISITTSITTSISISISSELDVQGQCVALVCSQRQETAV